MKILALLTLLTAKNEEDIIQYAVEDALRWADFIVCLDNNSTDNTGEILKSLADKYSQIYFWGKYEGPFHDWLRALVYNDYKHLIAAGDWVCRLDADEFYIDNPKDFLAQLPHANDLVYSASFQYYFSDQDLLTDNTLPAHQRMKYYLSNHSEQRFCKITDATFWPVTRPWPIGLSSIAEKRIRLKHFQYRTQEQMAKRFNTRQEVNRSQANTNLFLHELSNNKVFDSKLLIRDNGEYIIDEKNTPAAPHFGFKKKMKAHIAATIFNIKFIRNSIYPPSNTRTE